MKKLIICLLSLVVFVSVLFCGCGQQGDFGYSEISQEDTEQEPEMDEETSGTIVVPSDCLTPKVIGVSKQAIRQVLGNYPTHEENQEDRYETSEYDDAFILADYGANMSDEIMIVKYDSFGNVARVEWSTRIADEDADGEMQCVLEFYDERGYTINTDEYGWYTITEDGVRISIFERDGERLHVKIYSL